MKKLILVLLSSLFLFVACDLQEEDKSRPYDGTWVDTTDATYEMVLSEGSFSDAEMRGSVADITENTIEITYTAMKMPDGSWIAMADLAQALISAGETPQSASMYVALLSVPQKYNWKIENDMLYHYNPENPTIVEATYRRK